MAAMPRNEENILTFDENSRVVEGQSAEQVVLGSFSRILADTARLTAHLVDDEHLDADRAKIVELLGIGASSILQANHRYLLQVARRLEMMSEAGSGPSTENG